MPGESILTPIQRSVGVSAIKDSIYKEIEFRKETIMNEVIKAGEVFKLAELLPYQEGKFDKFGKHSVSATKQFKMALLLVLE